ncbi:MAG: hypothetical protein EA404_11815 [Spirochaetaceae bacterium]|nr:MAG: hypothetical protein EA404_11815 [Spirochaetaceae bacterium]
MNPSPGIAELVRQIYPDPRAKRCLDELPRLLEQFRDRLQPPDDRGEVNAAAGLDQADAIIIARADQFSGSDAAPLAYLHRFLREDLDGYATGVHIPGLTPPLSDDQRSLIDYRQVSAELGSWQDIAAIAADFQLMVDLLELNYQEPALLIEMLAVVLLSALHGARLIRFDSTAYYWTEPAAGRAHHPHARQIVALVRAVIEEVAPWVVIASETDEAHLVCNHALAPLTLDACIRRDSVRLQQWAANLRHPTNKRAFCNLLGSSDGIGVLPPEILSDAERANLVQTVESRGGRVSRHGIAEGDAPWELNTTWYSAVADPNLPDDQRTRIFMVSQSIMLCMAGVPAVHINSLIGTVNCSEDDRTIKRRALDYRQLVQELNDSHSQRHRVFEGYRQLLRARAQSAAFHPAARQDILETPQQVFAVLRTNQQQQSSVLCLHNLSGEAVDVSVTRRYLSSTDERSFRDLISGDYFFPHWNAAGNAEITLDAYEVMWLRLAT